MRQMEGGEAAVTPAEQVPELMRTRPEEVLCSTPPAATTTSWMREAIDELAHRLRATRATCQAEQAPTGANFFKASKMR